MKHLIFLICLASSGAASYAMFQPNFSRIAPILQKQIYRNFGTTKQGLPTGATAQQILKKYCSFKLKVGKECEKKSKNCAITERWLESTFVPKSLSATGEPIKINDRVVVCCTQCGVKEEFTLAPACDVNEWENGEHYVACTHKRCQLEGQALMPHYPMQRAVAVCAKCGYMEDIESNRPAEQKNNHKKEK